MKKELSGTKYRSIFVHLVYKLKSDNLGPFKFPIAIKILWSRYLAASSQITPLTKGKCKLTRSRPTLK